MRLFALPNVRAKLRAPVWRLAREADDTNGGIEGQVPRRWESARAKG